MKSTTNKAPIADSGARFLTSAQVMALFNYTNPGSFFAMIRSRAVPHVQINQRKILFDRLQLEHWIEKNSVGHTS